MSATDYTSSEIGDLIRENASLKAELEEKKGIWVMDNGYSSDRVFLCKELAEALRQRGHWVPADPSGPDIIIAIARALDRA